MGGHFSGIKISNGLAITHLLFVNDILIFYDGLKRDTNILTEGLKLFKLAMSMIIIIGRITLGINQQLNIFRPSSLSLVPCLELFVCFIGIDIDIVFFFKYLQNHRYCNILDSLHIALATSETSLFPPPRLSLP